MAASAPSCSSGSSGGALDALDALLLPLHGAAPSAVAGLGGDELADAMASRGAGYARVVLLKLALYEAVMRAPGARLGLRRRSLREQMGDRVGTLRDLREEGCAPTST